MFKAENLKKTTTVCIFLKKSLRFDFDLFVSDAHVDAVCVSVSDAGSVHEAESLWSLCSKSLPSTERREEFYRESTLHPEQLCVFAAAGSLNLIFVPVCPP